MNTSEPTPSSANRETLDACDSAGQKKCSNCGGEFQCGAAARLAGSATFSCWCEELPRVSLVAAADQDCLCPECLASAIGKLKGEHVGRL